MNALLRNNSILRVEIGNPISMERDKAPVVTLQITDSVSGETILDVEIPVEDWYALLRGGSHTTRGWVTPNTHRIGSVQQIETRKYGHKEIYDLIDTGDRYDPDLQEKAVMGDAAQRLPEGWDPDEDDFRAEYQRTNFGARVVYRRWVHDEDQYRSKVAQLVENYGLGG